MNSWYKYAHTATANLEYRGCNAVQMMPQCYPARNDSNQINLSSKLIYDGSYINPFSIYPAYSRSALNSDRQFPLPENNKSGASETIEIKSEFDEYLKNEAFMHINFPDLKIVIGAYRNISYLKQDF